MTEHLPTSADLVIRGGRVIDPESGLDEVTDVAVAGGRVVAVGDAPTEAAAVIDAAGCIVTAGFIDLHSHAQTVPGHRLQAFDGVTTTLELESGESPIASAYARVAAEGRPLNYGFSASWAAIRMEVLAGHPRNGLHGTFAGLGLPAWQRSASAAERVRLRALLEEDLAAGGLGVGILMGYAQGTDPEEYTEVARLAATAGRPTWTHARDLVEVRPDVLRDGAEEIVRTAAETGAHMHYCHVTSTSTHHVDRVLGLIADATTEGGTVTVEAYPYGAGSTAINARFLAPDQLGLRGLRPQSLVMVGSGERIGSVERLVQLRAADPGAAVLVEFLDDANEAHRAILRRALSFPGTVVASDAMPLVGPDDVAGHAPEEWPIPPGWTTHPRTAGTFTRSLRLLVDEVGESWADALARCSLLPARTLESAVPAMADKGRVRPGADADIVVFDPTALRDRATYVDGTRPSEGVRHLLVNGRTVIRDGVLDLDARPGRPVRAG